MSIFQNLFRDQKHWKLIQEFCKSNKIEIKNFSFKENKVYYFKTIKNKKTLICIHGFRGDKYFLFVELFLKLLEKGYSIITFDLPGHGENREVFSLEKSVKFVSEVIIFSKEKMNIPKKDLILLGQSMGGFICLLESYKNSVSAIITISALYKITPSPFHFLEWIFLFNKNFLRQFNYYSPNYLFYLRLFKKNNFFGNKKEMTEEAHQVSKRILEEIKKSKIPLLQIHGRFDLFVPFYQAKEINKNYGFYDKKLVTCFFANHLDTIFKKRTINEILVWLEKRSL